VERALSRGLAVSSVRLPLCEGQDLPSSKAVTTEEGVVVREHVATYAQAHGRALDVWQREWAARKLAAARARRASCPALPLPSLCRSQGAPTVLGQLASIVAVPLTASSSVSLPPELVLLSPVEGESANGLLPEESEVDTAFLDRVLAVCTSQGAPIVLGQPAPSVAAPLSATSPVSLSPELVLLSPVAGESAHGLRPEESEVDTVFLDRVLDFLKSEEDPPPLAESSDSASSSSDASDGEETPSTAARASHAFSRSSGKHTETADGQAQRAERRERRDRDREEREREERGRREREREEREREERQKRERDRRWREREKRERERGEREREVRREKEREREEREREKRERENIEREKGHSHGSHMSSTPTVRQIPCWSLPLLSPQPSCIL